eukprot:scaffold3586_cov404-Prasinococcus_capsulatus_cf.AAC.9
MDGWSGRVGECVGGRGILRPVGSPMPALDPLGARLEARGGGRGTRRRVASAHRALRVADGARMRAQGPRRCRLHRRPTADRYLDWRRGRCAQAGDGTQSAPKRPRLPAARVPRGRHKSAGCLPGRQMYGVRRRERYCLGWPASLH